MRRACALVVTLLALAGISRAQEALAAPVDRTDPKAVAEAYLEAIEAGDVAGALGLLDADATLKEGLQMATQEIQREGGGEGHGFRRIVTEIGFLPVGQAKTERELTGDVKDSEATFTVSVRIPDEKKLVLTKDAQGKWSVNFERSITATTGLKTSFIVDEVVRRGPGGPNSPAMRDGAKVDAIVRAAQVVLQWADEHDGRLPPAETWLDDVEAYSLTSDKLSKPGAGKGECGYGLNAALAGQTLPESMEERGKVVLLFECADFGRNVVGDPEQDLEPAVEEGAPAFFATADGMARAVDPEATPSETLATLEANDACVAHLKTIARAMRMYAREHDGCLPKAQSWCDDIGPYLEQLKAPDDVLKCPAAPKLEYGYAMNQALSGLDARSVKEHRRWTLLLHATGGTRNEAVALPATVAAGVHRELSSARRPACTAIGLLSGDAHLVEVGQAYPAGGM